MNNQITVNLVRHRIPLKVQKDGKVETPAIVIYLESATSDSLSFVLSWRLNLQSSPLKDLKWPINQNYHELLRKYVDTLRLSLFNPEVDLKSATVLFKRPLIAWVFCVYFFFNFAKWIGMKMRYSLRELNKIFYSRSDGHANQKEHLEQWFSTCLILLFSVPATTFSKHSSESSLGSKNLKYWPEMLRHTRPQLEISHGSLYSVPRHLGWRLLIWIEVNNNSTPYVVTLYLGGSPQLPHLMDQNINAGISSFMNGIFALYLHDFY